MASSILDKPPIRERNWNDGPAYGDNANKFLSYELLKHRYGETPGWNSEDTRRLSGKPPVFIARELRQQLHTHLLERSTEQGGLLVGRVYAAAQNDESLDVFAIEVLAYVPSKPLVSTAVFLTIPPDVWTTANSLLDDETLIVGWYHSHPNLGAFYSSTDKATQRALFNHAYSLGVVIDPIRGEERWHLGQNSAVIDSHLVRMVTDRVEGRSD